MIVAGLVMLVSVTWSVLNARRGPYCVSATGGTITPGKWSAAIVMTMAVVLFGAGMVVAGHGDGLTGSGMIVVGIVLAVFMGGSLTHAHDLTWTDSSIEGPSRLFGPGLGRSRTSLRWSEIAAAGKTFTGYWYVRAHDGRRIFWSFLYPGYGVFVERLRTRRPDVRLPDDLG